jgi:hypothetical protein
MVQFNTGEFLLSVALETSRCLGMTMACMCIAVAFESKGYAQSRT